MDRYPNSNLMKVNAWVTLFTWLILILTGVIYFAALMGVASEELLSVLRKIFLSGVLLHICMALLLKCPECGKMPTVQGFKEIHPDSNKKWGMDGWAVVILDVAFSHKFRCIHCGTEFHV